MAPTYGLAENGASVRDTLRAIRASGHPAVATGLVTQVTTGAPLELAQPDKEVPRLEAAGPIEGGSLVAMEPKGAPEPGFAAFLDGTQESRVIARWDAGLPLVHGTAAAVVRVRSDRRLATWRGSPRVSRALYLPFGVAGEARVEALRMAGLEVLDTEPPGAAAEPGPRHPLELSGLARTAVQRRREVLETALAEAWCASERTPLFVDGGLSARGTAARSALAVGVVKSHRTLYATDRGVGVVMGLLAGERTTAFEIRSPRRTTVASWYLRLRDAAGRDPFFGLVRVEVAREAFTSAHADLVSRWILAERAPVALPDPRWSTMSYGIRDCEEYLRAVVAG
jgi:hypothetical protein